MSVINQETTSTTLAPIFIADDESDDRFFIERRLRMAGATHPLVEFRDGEELVRMLEKIAAHEIRPPCLLLLDLKMPLLDGFDVIRWLRARAEFQVLPVAVITSCTRPSDRARVAQTGVTEFMEKFPSADELARVVTWASNHPVGAPARNGN